ncbi:hypothetical protein MCAV_02920 [[Mycoplasma] cavipharyngis]|uniref:hypothetical protein n=1 Tax=[Mycoplasma] cavipharyngis TaxID=92757 RepID=UPI003704666C
MKLKKSLKKQIFLSATLGLISTSVLSACAPNYNSLVRSKTNLTSNRTNNQSLLPNLPPLNNDNNNSNNNNSNNGTLDDVLSGSDETKLNFSNNFYQTTKFQRSSDIDPRFQGFDSDLNPEYILKAPKYKNIITNLSKEQIRNDILDNLKYLVLTNSKIKIDFTNLKLDFQLVKSNDNLLIKNFKLVFSLYNQNNQLLNLFNSVMIPAFALTQVVIQFNQAHINPNLKKNNASDGKIDQFFSAWTVDSSENNISAKLNNLKVVVGDNNNQILQSSSVQSNLSFVEQTLHHLDFIFARSFALNTYYTRLTTGFDFAKLNQETTKNISNLTSQEIKADLNHSEINLTKIYYVNLVKDIYNILKYFSIKNVSQNDGKTYSLIDLIYNETTLAGRKKILSGFGIPLTAINLIASIFDQSDKPSLDDIYAFIETFVDYDLASFIYDHLKIRLDWIKDPVINNEIPNQPRVSLKYIKTVELDQDLTIKLNTITNDSVTTTNNDATDVTITENNEQKPERKYNVSKVLNLKVILGAFGLDVSDNKNPLNSIITSVASDLDLSNLNIPKGTKISTTYEVKDGNLSLYMAKTFDHKIANNYTLGWQVDQVHSSTDLSGLYQFLIPFFSQLNAVQTKISNKNLFAAEGILKLVDKVKKFDLKALFEILTYFYVPNSQSKNTRSKNWITKEGLNDNDLEKRVERPVEKFLRLLLAKKFEFSNSQITALVSNAFYDLPETINDQPLYTETNLKSKVDSLVPNLDQSQNQTVKIRAKRSTVDLTDLGQFDDEAIDGEEIDLLGGEEEIDLSSPIEDEIIDDSQTDQTNDQQIDETTTTLANPNNTISSSYTSNDQLNLNQLVASAKPGVLLEDISNKSNQNQTNLQLIWKLSDQKSLADNYQNFYSNTTASINGTTRNNQYEKIIKTITKDGDVVDPTNNATKPDLLNKFETAAIASYSNPLNTYLKPYVSIFQLPLFSVFNEILQGDFAQGHALDFSKNVKNALKGLISTVVSLNPYLVSTNYPLNPDQIGILKDNKYSTELEDRQTSVSKFIAPKTDFGKVKFPNKNEITQEFIKSLLG